jgi:hypothetical protein
MQTGGYKVNLQMMLKGVKARQEGILKQCRKHKHTIINLYT